MRYECVLYWGNGIWERVPCRTYKEAFDIGMTTRGVAQFYIDERGANPCVGAA